MRSKKIEDFQIWQPVLRNLLEKSQPVFSLREKTGSITGCTFIFLQL
jgi:hypothetical protein